MMKRREFLVSVVGGSLALASLRPVKASDYIEHDPLFMDCQTWWQARGAKVPSHYHIAAYMPLRHALGGLETMVLQLEAFNQPPGTKWDSLAVLIDKMPGQTIVPDNWPWDVGTGPGGHVSREVRITFSTLHPEVGRRRDGWTILKLSGRVQRFDGQMILRTRIPIYFQNGYPVAGGDPGKLWCGAAGWFIDLAGNNHQYPTVRLYAESEQEAIHGVPTIWYPVIGVMSSFTPLSRMRVCVNPAFHNLSATFPQGNPGIVIYDGEPVIEMPVQIDTRLLPRGWNRLFVQAIENHFSTGSSAGVAVYHFLVR
jgi:hypothetical protein